MHTLNGTSESGTDVRKQAPDMTVLILATKAKLSSRKYNKCIWRNRSTGWTIGVLGFDSRRGLGIFLFTAASRTALWPTQPPTQWVPGALFQGVKRQGREADHLTPSSAEVKECVDLYLHSPIRLHGVVFS
jgi:hypothetical protein